MRLPDLFLRRVQRGARLLFMFGLHTGLIRAVAGISKACSSNGRENFTGTEESGYL